MNNYKIRQSAIKITLITTSHILTSIAMLAVSYFVSNNLKLVLSYCTRCFVNAIIDFIISLNSVMRIPLFVYFDTEGCFRSSRYPDG